MKAKDWGLAIALIGLVIFAGCNESGSGSITAEQVLPVAGAAEQDADGVAIHLGETVSTEGIVTVGPGLLANQKLKVFIQGSPEGIMVYHESSAEVDEADFQPGNLVQVSGVIRQADPSSDNNLAIGTVLIDISEGSWEVLSTGNPLPLPVPVTLAELESNGNAYEGALVNVIDVHKVSGTWPALGDKSKSVTVRDDSGAAKPTTVRFQRFTIGQEMADRLDYIDASPLASPLHLTGIAVQNDPDDSDGLLAGFQIWPRGQEDIINPVAILGEEDGGGDALMLGETVTAEGIVTVASGVLFDKKFEVFIQDSTGGLMLLHPDAATLGVDVSPGDLVLATGTIAQTDGSGQPLDGTVRVDLTGGGTLEVLSRGNALPAPQLVTLAEYLDDPGAYEGELIRVNGVTTSDEWPDPTKKGTLSITDDDGTTTVNLQVQKGANTADLELAGTTFDVVGIAVQNGASWEVWVRSADDINP